MMERRGVMPLARGSPRQTHKRATARRVVRVRWRAAAYRAREGQQTSKQLMPPVAIIRRRRDGVRAECTPASPAKAGARLGMKMSFRRAETRPSRNQERSNAMVFTYVVARASDEVAEWGLAMSQHTRASLCQCRPRPLWGRSIKPKKSTNGPGNAQPRQYHKNEYSSHRRYTP